MFSYGYYTIPTVSESARPQNPAAATAHPTMCFIQFGPLIRFEIPNRRTIIAWLGNTDPAQYLPPTISSLSASKTSLYFRLDFTFCILPNRDTNRPTCI